MTRVICASHIYIPILLFFIIVPIYSGIDEVRILLSHDYNFDCDTLINMGEWDKYDCRWTERAVDWKIGIGIAMIFILLYERNDIHKWFRVKDCNK